METTTVEAASAAGPNLIFWIGSGGLFCLFSMVMLYNLVVLVGVLRSDEAASGFAKAAWGLSLLSMFAGPCAWFFGLVAIIMARVETRRIYRDESPLASVRPARMASFNAGVMFVLSFMAIAVGVLGIDF